MLPTEKGDLSEHAWREIKMHIDLYRENYEDPYLPEQEWREVKQSCEYILSPYGMWDAHRDKLNEPAIHNAYMNLR